MGGVWKTEEMKTYGTEGTASSSRRLDALQIGNDAATEEDAGSEHSGYYPEDLDEAPEHGRNIAAFFLFGLINNFSYVVFLSAAEHIFEDHSGAVLLVNAMPGLVVKLCYGFGIYRVPYVYRICAVALVPCGMFFVVAGSETRWVRLAAIAFVSLIGGLGETSFLSMTATYSRRTIGAWSSGTGGAGIFGAGFYFLLTVSLRLSPKTTLRLSSPFPLLLILTFVFILQRPTRPSVTDHGEVRLRLADFRERLPLLRSLLWKYMLPLMLVYYLEYTINQGVLPVIDFTHAAVSKHRNGPKHRKEPHTNTTIRIAAAAAADASSSSDRNWQYYVTYQLLYQIGVFISRSSISFVKIRKLWLLTFLQFANLVVFLMVAVSSQKPTAPGLVMALVLWEGLLGGASYVNTFWYVSQEAPTDDREWALGVTSIADTVGITLSAVTDTFLECALRKARHQECH